MDVTIYYNVCASTSYMQLFLAKWISYYSGATYEWQNRYNDNMMASILKKVDDQNGFKLVNFNCSNKKETPKENKDLENDFKAFLEQGISSLVREGEFYI